MRRISIALVLSGCGGAVDSGELETVAAGGAESQTTSASSPEAYEATGGSVATTTSRAVSTAGGAAVASSSSAVAAGGSVASGGSNSKATGGSSARASSTVAAGTRAVGGSSATSTATTARCRDSFRPHGTCTIVTTECGWQIEFTVSDASTGVSLKRFGCGDGIDGDSCGVALQDATAFADARCATVSTGGAGGSGGSPVGGTSATGGSAPKTTSTSAATECRGFIDGITVGDQLCLELPAQGSCFVSESPMMPNRELCGYRASLVCSEKSVRNIACYRACVACAGGSSDECTVMLNQPMLVADPCEWQP